MKLKNHIKKLRTENGLTQQQLADAVGVSRQTISYLELGKKSPSSKLALKICKVLDEPFENVFFLSIDNCNDDNFFDLESYMSHVEELIKKNPEKAKEMFCIRTSGAGCSFRPRQEMIDVLKKYK